MKQNSDFQEHLNIAKMMVDQGKDDTSIESAFNKLGVDVITVSEILNHIKKFRIAKRTQNGTTLILIGVAILGLGFVSTILLHNMGASIDFALYGLTAIGAIVLVAGLVMIFH